MAVISESQSRALSEFILLPSYMSAEHRPENIDLGAPLTLFREGEDPKITLNIPFLSAAMQSVTGPKTAIELAKRGGLGVIFCSQMPEKEAEMVREVKSYKAGFVVPVVFSPDDYINDVIEMINQKKFSTFPVTDTGEPNGRLVGIITKKDFHESHRSMRIRERMIPLSNMEIGVEIEDLGEANNKLTESHHGSLPITDSNGRLKYLVFRKDIDEHLSNPLQLVDKRKRYMAGAAVNTLDYKERIPMLAEAGADVIFIDSSHGASEYQKNVLSYMKENYPDLPVIGGNVVTTKGFNLLAESGAWGVKIGMGPGSICMTQKEIRVGRGQATAIMQVAQARDEYFNSTGVYVPIIADGGITDDSEITIALALGADSVMMGRYFARFDESPTEKKKVVKMLDGDTYETYVKPYWGEASDKAKSWREKRYGENIEEGVSGSVPYAGALKENVEKTLQIIKAGIRRAGCLNIKDMHRNAQLEIRSDLAKKEGDPHSILPDVSEGQ